MRRLGIGALGLAGGMLLALVVHAVFGAALFQDGGGSNAFGAVLGVMTPVLAAAGVVVALLLDNRRLRNREKNTRDR